MGWAAFRKHPADNGLNRASRTLGFGSPTVAIDAVRVHARAFAKDFPTTSQLQVAPRDFHASGDLAYEYGEFTQQVSPEKGKPINVTGHYVVVLKRQADGAWKLVKHLSVTQPTE